MNHNDDNNDNNICRLAMMRYHSRRKKENLKKQVEKLTTVIDETKKRLPAHSTKPPIMMELLELEDRYDQLIQQLNKLEVDEN